MESLAAATGVPEAALRFLLGILLPYPIVGFYRLIVGPSAPTRGINSSPSSVISRPLKGLYFFVTGLAILLFGFGIESLHLLVQAIGTYVFVCLIGRYSRKLALLLTWIGNMGYLLTAYYFYSTDKYDIDWTTPSCVLVLRAIAFAFDYYDGGQLKNPKQTAEEKENAILSPPSLFDVLGFFFFPSSLIAGPQFTFRRYEKYINNQLLTPPTAQDEAKYTNEIRSIQIGTVLGRLLLGAVYLAVHEVLMGYGFGSSSLREAPFVDGRPLPNMPLAPLFNAIDSPLLYRIFHLFVFGKATLQKYIGVWLIVDGSIVLSGLGFGGWNQNKETGTYSAKWNGLSNVDPYLFETATNIRQVVAAFNINTNDWVRRYVYVRMTKAGIGSQISQVSSLVFLAVWHGFAPGYFLCFFAEFLDLSAHLKLATIFRPFTTYIYNGDIKPGAPPPDMSKDTPLKQLLRVAYDLICSLVTSLAMSYGLIAFELKRFDITKDTYSYLYYLGHIIPGVLTFLPISSRSSSTPRPPKKTE
eukprot:TRINITY_DN13135_c0_g1_i1.p1 TRINITY_DN13135_c0_g1~~TRINITY_DN13135_c0_g1_i1.p1  ORF type:complete len:526 (+),score=139.15 TRINITY_DN13135_c0_g1_i1:51-1628(+)